MKLVTMFLITSIFLRHQFILFAQTCIEDRVPSMNAAIGMTGSGTCWILPNGKLATTEHTSYGTKVVFNIYSDNQSPAPEDTYQIVPNSHIRSTQHDWAVFEVEATSGKTPIQRQNAFFKITRDFNLQSVTNIRMRGHGSYDDDGQVVSDFKRGSPRW